jgi:hypothetical protein
VKPGIGRGDERDLVKVLTCDGDGGSDRNRRRNGDDSLLLKQYNKEREGKGIRWE